MVVVRRFHAAASIYVSADFGFRVEPDWSGGLPVAGFAKSAFRIVYPCICIENGAVCLNDLSSAVLLTIRRAAKQPAIGWKSRA